MSTINFGELALANLKRKSAPHEQTCAEYALRLIKTDSFDYLIQAQSADRCFNADPFMRLMALFAKDDGVVLTDLETFNADEFFHRVFQGKDKEVSV